MTEKNLAGRRIAITGAARGLGRALAIIAADHGADVVLLGRDQSALEAVAEIIRTRSEQPPMVVQCDLSQPESVASASAAILEANPIVDVLVNNGAPWLPGDFDELTDEQIISTISAAVTGTVLFTKGLLPGLIRSAAADVVTIISTCGILGWDVNGASAPFFAAKHGQSGFSDRLRQEVKKHAIRVCAIYPPDFDDLDPLDPRWEADEAASDSGNLTNREVVSTVLFQITAPRTCNYPVVVMENMR